MRLISVCMRAWPFVTRPIPFCAVALIAMTNTCFADTTLHNASEWRAQWLQQGHTAARLKTIRGERGCSPSQCSIDVGDIACVPDENRLRRIGGKTIELKAISSSPLLLPEMDFEPLGSEGKSVFSHGKRWGTCLEFSHSGLGKSGTAQRWRSVVLVPRTGKRSSLQAWRFVGYWASCDQLSQGATAQDIVFPTLEPQDTTKAGLRLIVHNCTRTKCSSELTPLLISGDPTNPDDGSLTLIGE